MKFPSRLLIPLVFVFSACPSASKVAKNYSALGQHELAAQYFAQEYLKDRASIEATADLHQALQLATRDLEADYDAAALAKKSRKALGIALRQEELMRWAYKMRLKGIELGSVTEKSARAHKDARRQSVNDVDQSESANHSPKKRLALLREAIALDPDNSELNDRYERLQRKLKRLISVRTECSSQDQESCEAALKSLLESMSASRRELFTVVNQASDIATAQLVLRMQTVHSGGSWQRGPMGRVAHKIKKRNEFKEVVLNKHGKATYKQVRAEYAIFHRTHKASASIELIISDLRENQPNLFEKQVKKTESEKKSYYTWSGDERALDARSDITRLGTSQAVPASTQVLARRAWSKLIQTLGDEIIEKLEN